MCPASYPTLGFSSCQLTSAGPVLSSTETFHRSCTWTELPCQTMWRCFGNHQVSCLTDLVEGFVSKLRSAMPEKPQALWRFQERRKHFEDLSQRFSIVRQLQTVIFIGLNSAGKSKLISPLFGTTRWTRHSGKNSPKTLHDTVEAKRRMLGAERPNRLVSVNMLASLSGQCCQGRALALRGSGWKQKGVGS